MMSTAQLRQRIQDIRTAQPHIRNRQLARELGISEAELLTVSPGSQVVRLTGDWKALLQDLKSLGYVMALTRNEACVHERKGVYDNITFYEGAHNVGVAVNPDIDLRFFMNEWVYALAVTMPRSKGDTLYSFQFFNARGVAVHKVFATPDADLNAYNRLVEKYKGPQEPIFIEDRSSLPPTPIKSDDDIDISSFQHDWLALKDTHDFFPLLKSYDVSRTQALRLAPKGMTVRVDRLAVEQVLQKVAEREVPIMCFVHSPGCVQIHTGPIHRLMWHKEWYNVMDKAFNLHLDTQAIDSCWIVRKPTKDGIVTSLELFDKAGELIVYFFGARKPGVPELEEWRSIIQELETASQSNDIA